MNRDDIIRMAREAGVQFVPMAIAVGGVGGGVGGGQIFGSSGNGSPVIHSVGVNIIARLEQFAELVTAAEREACAKASESQIDRWVDDRARYAASECAAAIRARGAKDKT